MATWYIDYSAARLSAATIKGTAVGPAGEHPTGVIRYIDAPENLKTKHTNKAEYDDLVRSGLNMSAMYFENGYEDPNTGYAGGQANARRALRGAEWLGFKGVVLMCCDRWFVQAPHQPVTAARWQAYLDGAVSVLGRARTGAYGFRDAIDAAQGHVDYFVQCGSRSVLHPKANGWQDNNTQPKVGGIATDRVLILKNFATQEDDLTPDQANQLAAVYDNLITPVKSYVPGSTAAYNTAQYVRYNNATLYDQAVNQWPALKTSVADIAAKVATLESGGVDLDTLAAKVAELVAPALAAAVGPAVAEEIKNRLEN